MKTVRAYLISENGVGAYTTVVVEKDEGGWHTPDLTAILPANRPAQTRLIRVESTMMSMWWEGDTPQAGDSRRSLEDWKGKALFCRCSKTNVFDVVNMRKGDDVVACQGLVKSVQRVAIAHGTTHLPKTAYRFMNTKDPRARRMRPAIRFRPKHQELLMTRLAGRPSRHATSQV